MQTNATVTLSNGDKTATLTLNGETLVAEIQATSAGTFSTQLAVASSLDPVLPLTGLSANQPNPGVTVLTIALGAGQQLIQVLFKYVSFTLSSRRGLTIVLVQASIRELERNLLDPSLCTHLELDSHLAQLDSAKYHAYITPFHTANTTSIETVHRSLSL
jgi:hypothetical protein